MTTAAREIVLTDAKPLKRDERCPGCGAGKDKRVASGGFGAAHPVCQLCGHEWTDEVWRG